MTFLEPCKKGGYFGSRQFHLRLLKTIPAQPQKQYLPAYLFEMVANGQPIFPAYSTRSLYPTRSVQRPTG